MPAVKTMLLNDYMMVDKYKVDVCHHNFTIGWAVCTQLWASSAAGEEQQ